MTDDKLIPDVDTPPAPSQPIGEPKRKGATIYWRDVFRRQITELVGKLRQGGKAPKSSEIKAMFPAHDLTHYWDNDPEQPIKSRRKTWNREVRRFFKVSNEDFPLLKTPRVKKTAEPEDLF